jgi:response regulator RpfG family c-di-GMP phosphodiesterase
MARYAERFLEWLNEHDGSGWDEARTRQLLMSAWLHDVGKLVVPLEVMDKESRLGPKINAVLDRFKLFGLQNEIDYLKNSISKAGYELRAGEISKAGELVTAANTAGALTEEQLSELRALGEKSMNGPDGETPCLTEDELTCLMVRFGTLTNEERGVMENHVLMTRRMLSEMNFPKRFQDVPDWASAHHEFLNGKGYPDKLAEDAIPLEVRILTILDIYDALTARDRPYKPGMPAEKAFSILESMAGDGKLDTGLLRLFKESEAWKQ